MTAAAERGHMPCAVESEATPRGESGMAPRVLTRAAWRDMEATEHGQSTRASDELINERMAWYEPPSFPRPPSQSQEYL